MAVRSHGQELKKNDVRVLRVNGFSLDRSGESRTPRLR